MSTTNNLGWAMSEIPWIRSASDILNEQAEEESIQKSVGALLTPSTENQPWWPTLLWKGSASEILNEQAAEEAE